MNWMYIEKEAYLRARRIKENRRMWNIEYKPNRSIVKVINKCREFILDKVSNLLPRKLLRTQQ